MTENGTGAVLDSAESSLYNARALPDRPLRAGLGAQVAQLVEHVTENHGVGGSIPPLGTRKLNYFRIL
jgi:hypothetical protein